MSSIMDQLLPSPENFRTVAQTYTDQVSLLRRTTNAISAVLSQVQSSGSVLFNASKDPLSKIDGLDEILEIQTRVVDLLLLAGMGQAIEIEEFQEYAQRLVALYTNLELPKKLKASAIKDQAVRELEQEWLGGNDMIRVQQFFKAATAGITNAAQFCNVKIGPLPTF